MSTITPVHTSCKNCVFADYSGNSQTGCSIDYLEKYRNINATILEAYDEEKEFYVINGKKCLCYRENSWFKQYDMEASPLQDKINKVKEQNHLHYLLVINLYNFSDENLQTAVQEISQLSVKPQKIIFIRYMKNRSFEFNVLNSMLKESGLDCRWRIQSMIDDSLTHEQILHNIVNINKNYRFIVSVKEPASNIEDIVNYADKTVYEELGSLHVLSNKDQTITLFSAPSYRFSLLVEHKNILEDPTYVNIV